MNKLTFSRRTGTGHTIKPLSALVSLAIVMSGVNVDRRLPKSARRCSRI
jgi:hypothetical protein